MEEVQAGKAVSKSRAKPTVVTIGEKRQISTGRYDHDLVAQEIVLMGNKKPIPLGAIATFAHGSGSIRNKKNVRKNLRRTIQLVMSRGYLAMVLYDPAHPHSAQFVKLFNPKSEEDRQTLDERLNMMLRQEDLVRSEYIRAKQLAEATEITEAA